MLVIANGAPKTGSTWVRHIAANILEYKDIPDKYANKAWGPVGEKRSIAPYSVDSFLKQADYKSVNYLSKNHFYNLSTYKTLIKYSDVKILCIERELKDVVVSYYYHQIRKGTFSKAKSFEEYYWKYGRYFIQFMTQYQNIWHQDSEKVYVSSYERLKTEFDSECFKIGKFLGYELTFEMIEAIKKDTSMDSMRKKWGEADKKKEDVQFFRKGILGAWANHFNDKVLEDYNEVVERGLTGIDYLRYLILYPFRLKLLHTYQQFYYTIRG